MILQPNILEVFCMELFKEQLVSKQKSHSVENWEIHSHFKNISWNQPFSNFFSKRRCFHEIFVRVKMLFRQCGNCRKLLSGKTFVKATFSLKKLLKRWFHEIFFSLSGRVNFCFFFTLKQCNLREINFSFPNLNLIHLWIENF